MTNNLNTGIYLTNQADKKNIIKLIMRNTYLREYLNLSALKGELFSALTIDKLIDEEYRHDTIMVNSAENTCLSSMSSGQQKKALLKYLIGLQPDYLILDDVFSNVDKTTQDEINTTLNKLSATTLIIQLVYRKKDTLACINQILHIDKNNYIIKSESKDAFLNSEKTEYKNNFKLPESFSCNFATSDNLIEMKSVSVNYDDKKILQNINWIIKPGEFWQLAGPNGSGKSTLVSIISGDNPKAYGQNILLFGRKKGSGETIWDIKKNIGYFTPRMLEHFTKNETVENMLISGLTDSLGLYVLPTDSQKKLAKSWIAMLGNSFSNKYFHQLTIGQQRMVMVVRAMIKHPPLLILDEPTIELDEENTSLFIDMINTIASEKSMAIIYISHREEDTLKPKKIFELVKTTTGAYTGNVREL